MTFPLSYPLSSCPNPLPQKYNHSRSNRRCSFQSHPEREKDIRRYKVPPKIVFSHLEYSIPYAVKTKLVIHSLLSGNSPGCDHPFARTYARKEGRAHNVALMKSWKYDANRPPKRKNQTLCKINEYAREAEKSIMLSLGEILGVLATSLLIAVNDVDS
jgi:hypothetical protein